MERLITLLLAAVMCLTLCACGAENDTAATTEESVDTTADSESTTVPDHTSELTDILCGGKWVSRIMFPTDISDELIFNTNGTFSWTSEEGVNEATWRFQTYYGSFKDLPIPIAAGLAQDSCVYWGAVDIPTADYVGHDGFIVGYNEAGAPVMSFNGTSWTKEE